jgi:hypothetical protein
VKVSPSFERINYALRPAKNIERKMLAETFRHLTRFQPVRDYRYVGLGSVYFSDFVLFHKALGITDMLCIERESDSADRVEFNRPFGCVQIEMSSTAGVLPSLSWDKKSIVWLDYDSILTAGALADIDTVASHAPSGSVLAITLNAHPKLMEDSIDAMREDLGPEVLPERITPDDFAGWKGAAYYWSVLSEVIRTSLERRNDGHTDPSPMKFRQLIHFRYQDSARMFTMGGLLHSEADLPTADACGFERLDFCRDAADSFVIDVPKLTFREIRLLDRRLPAGHPKETDLHGIPAVDLERYTKLYRFFPGFVEAEF